MAFTFSRRSLDALAGVHPDLVRVVRRALSLGVIDFMVTEGVRSQARQLDLYAQGRTRPGKIVTWTKNSRHFKSTRTGYGHAVDLLPAPFDYKDVRPFDALAGAMFAAADIEGVAIRWGADWDRDGRARERGETDSPHFELADA